ncbi:hypothetical protein IW261DRAFT_1469501 [Armillaria novae-zelandiae]|uniref:ZZ-type domain-containing protein n=1 Tax=Armillaria novae-zelandiae TaxID=153914 RepID=A0AA39UDH4_9AGAR|nr:hypothetical protein IW261DRAFT_1469501 [Armillaria novae-zelandiae]
MTSETDGIIATADATLEHTELKAPGRFERKLNSSIDKYSDATPSQPFANAVNATISSGVGSFVVSQLSGWSAVSSALIATLDELQKIHPFISVAVLPFKAALSLELKQRENDEKIITLHVLMQEMMKSLMILKNISATDGENMKAYLTEILQNIARDITECATASGVYYGRNLISRILKSKSYESDLAVYGDKFERHRQNLLLRLNTRINVKLNEVTESLSTIRLFDMVRSPKERELMGLIDKEGGASKVMQDPALLEKIIKANGKNNKDRTSARQTDTDKKIISVIQAEIRQDLRELIKTNEDIFNRKFEAQKRSLVNALGETVERMGDRVITAVISGPYERLINQDLYNIWKEMHWRGSAKARDLVLALRDYYYSRTNQSTLARQMGEIVSPTTTTENDSEASRISEAIVHSVDDQWALPYINLLRIQPLMEAFDDDVSGFVTINEANALCAGRPENWSLLHWMAYWAVGFQMTLFQYYMQIQTLLQQMHTAAEQTLPANRVFVDTFLNAWPFKYLDRLLLGFKEQISYHGTWNWNDWSKFLPYVQDEEKRLKDQLEAFQYNIDASDSLLLITGPGRLERFIFPLVYLLLERQCLIIKYCHSNVIHPGILWSSLKSVDVIMDAVEVRVEDLQAIFKQKNLDEAVMMRKSVYGLFSSWGSTSPYYRLNKHALSGLELIPDLQLEIDQTSVDFINLKPALLTGDNGIVGRPDNTDNMSSKLPALLDRNKEIYELEGFSTVVGTWVGSYDHKRLGTEGVMVLCITDTQADGIFKGFGTGAGIGEFTIQGKLSSQGSDSTRVIFYESHNKGLAANRWRYEGTITSSGVMEGRRDSENDQEGTYDFETTNSTTQDGIIGQFFFEHHPIEYHVEGFWLREHEYQDLVFQYGPSRASHRARWAYAIRVVLHRIRTSSQEMRWSHLKERRDQRRQFIDLIIQRDCRAGWLPYVSGGSVDWDMMDTLALLEHSLYPQDILHLYHSLAWFKARRQIDHGGIECNTCKKDIIGTRFICLNCLLEYGDDSTDFCVRCHREDFENDKVVHTGYHPILQLRRCLALRRLFLVANTSRAALEKARARLGDPSGDPQCGNCKQNVSSPCWFCVDCDDEFFLCFACNAHDNATEPWMMDKHLCPEEGHTYVHKLVLCPEPKPDEPVALTMEERLAATEKHMETMEKHIKEMEKHMVATTKHTETHIQTAEKHIEETKKHIEASQCSLQELLELQKENNDAIQKRIEKMLTWGAGLIVLIFAIWAMVMRG